MPNRIIKESICTSENIDQLSAFEETVFVRLMVNCDDFGRFDGRAKILSARLFPLKSVSPEDIETALQSLVNADLVTVYEVDGKPFLHMNSWEKHQTTRASKSKYPAPDEGTCKQLQAKENNCLQKESDDGKCSRIRIRNSLFDNRNSDSLIGDNEAHAIQAEQDRVFDAAEDAGFKVSNSVRANLLKLYAEHGLDKLLNAFESCVKHGAPNLAYLEACLKDQPKKKKGETYSQRDYTEVQDDFIAKQNARIAARLNGEGA